LPFFVGVGELVVGELVSDNTLDFLEGQSITMIMIYRKLEVLKQDVV